MADFDRLFRKPSKDNFAQLLLRRFRDAVPGCDLAYNQEEFQLCPQRDNGIVVNLTNIYAEYCAASSAKRSQLLDNYIASFVSGSSHELPGTFDDAKDGIMPSIRSRSYFELTMFSAELELEHLPTSVPIYQPINAHLVCAFVFDNGPSMRFLSKDDLDQWGTTEYEIIELAKHNFENSQPMGFSKIGDNFYSVLGDEDYGATRMLHMEFLERMEVQGDYVAAVPNRGTLMVTGTDSLNGLAVMAALLEKEEGPRPITNVLFRWKGDEWEPWLPPPDHPTYAAFKLAAVKSIGREYQEQKALLEKLCEKRGDDAFVANFSATQHKTTGEVSSYCVWSKGVPALLPKTDTIGLVGDNQDVIGMVPWDEVVRVASDLMVAQGMYPERYRVESFLTDEHLAALAGSLI